MKIEIDLPDDGPLLEEGKRIDEELTGAGFCPDWAFLVGIALGRLAERIGVERARTLLFRWLLLIERGGRPGAPPAEGSAS